MSPQFARTPNPAPLAAERAARSWPTRIRSALHRPHGDDPLDGGRGWHDAAVVPYGPLRFDPATMVLHYGQEIFEGLKAYRQARRLDRLVPAGGERGRFRGLREPPRDGGAARRAVPASLAELLAVDHEWVPAAGGERRRCTCGRSCWPPRSGWACGRRPEYLYVLIASPAGRTSRAAVKPIDVWLSTEYTRAALGRHRHGEVRRQLRGSLLPQARARRTAARRWLPRRRGRTWVDEMGSNNLFFVYGSGEQTEVVTPALTGSILAGVTRDSLLVLAKELGCQVSERRISGQSGSRARPTADHRGLRLRHRGGDHPDRPGQAPGREVRIGDGEPGPITLQLRSLLTKIQRGAAPDTHSWMHTLYTRLTQRVSGGPHVCVRGVRATDACAG
jgi:branched-chain amino acid aminotransferase